MSYELFGVFHSQVALKTEVIHFLYEFFNKITAAVCSKYRYVVIRGLLYFSYYTP